ncbi:MAG: N-acetylmuramoyl-L-alanine amidase [Candidatus Sulfobium sp.]|jgi:N-acetylmuramoyl-L-alanine amidase
MISPFTVKRESKTRESILKGVYEENMKILGKRGSTLARPRPFYIRKVFLTVAVTALAVFLHAQYGSAPFSSESQVTAGLIAQKAASPVVARSSAPPHYPDVSGFKAIMHEPGMPISRIFGLGVKTIMIDPGHGGKDRGTMGKLGTREKVLTLDVAKRLKALLEHDGQGRFRVLLTRDRDVTLPLDERVKMALDKKADLFVSIHFNYIPAKPINIIETYYFGPSSDEKALKLAERENAGSHYGMSDFRQIIEKLGETMKLQESRELAASIQNELFVNMKREDGIVHNYGVRRAPFVVLLGAEVPAVLVEVSCLSNRAEEKRLDTKHYRENIAHYLEAGIIDYMKKGDIGHEKTRYAKR